MSKVRIKKEDQVVVIAGKDRDLTKPRRVIQVMPSANKAVVEGVNMIKSHTRPNPQANSQGGIVEREAPIHISNLMLWDPQAKRGTRVRSEMKGDKRVRISVRTGNELK